MKHLIVKRESIRLLGLLQLRDAHGGSPDQSEKDICGPGSVPPYVCATDVRCDESLGPCDQSAFGPCG